MKIAISTSKNKNKNKRFKITISSWYFKNTFEICNPTSKPFTLNSVSFIMQILTMLLNLVSSLRITLSCLGKLTCSCDGTSSSTYGRHAFFSGMSYTVACVWVSVCLHIITNNAWYLLGEFMQFSKTSLCFPGGTKNMFATSTWHQWRNQMKDSPTTSIM